MVNVIVEQDVRMQTRDGVTLRADVYRPTEAGRYPVILNRTPYGKAGVPTATYHSPIGFAQAGYVVVVQDCRGTGNSDDVFRYLRQLPQEGLDGYDAVEWSATLPYSDGNVGMCGGSYVGWTQWAAAMQRPPHLRAIVPMVTWSYCHQGLLYRGGAFELGIFLNWHLIMGINVKARQMRAAGASEDEISRVTAQLLTEYDRLSSSGFHQVPLNNLPALRDLGMADVIAYLVEMRPAQQPTGWDVHPEDVNVPALNMGGWADILIDGTINAYKGCRLHGHCLAKQSQLLIGPWIHGAYTSMVGELDLGSAANGGSIEWKDSLFAMHLRWFDHYLKELDNGIERQEPVKLFVTGENRWLSLPDWPPTSTPRTFYFQPGGLLKDTPPLENAGSSCFRYDPSDPVPTLGGNTLLPAVYPAGYRDQRMLSQRRDVLTLFSTPLEKQVLAIGSCITRLWISSSAPDTDFVVRLLDIHPDGYMQNICDSIQRARYRESLAEPVWLEPGKAYELTIDLWATAHTFLTGHRVGLQVTSSSFPRWDRNWNTTEDPAEATSGVVADQTIWHDAAHPSCIILPVVD